MTTAAEVKARLEAGALDDLCALVVDHVLDRPVRSLVDPERVGEQVVAAFETATRSARTEEWLRERVARVRDAMPDGTPGDRVPAEIRAPLRDVIGRPYLADRALVGRLLDHEAFERLLRDVLVGTIGDFTQKIRQLRPNVPFGGEWPPIPTPAVRGLGRLKALGQGVKDIGEGVFGGLSQELEQRAEQRIREFVDGALRAVVDQVADHLCADEHASRYAGWRVHVLDTVLATDLRTLAAEADKLDPEGLVATGTAIVRSLARRDGFREEVAGMVRVALDAGGDQSLRDLLRETGLEAGEAEWREATRAALAARGREFVATAAFDEWLGKLLG